MLLHVVLLTPRPDLTIEEQRRFVDAFERATHRIPAVRGVRVGRRVTFGAGYEAAAPGADFLAILEFDDLAGLQAYLRHPAHDELGNMLAAITGASVGHRAGAAMVFDFEVAKPEDLSL